MTDYETIKAMFDRTGREAVAMHTTTLRTNDGEVVTLNHNANWSGDVYVSWDEGGGHTEVRIPGWLGNAIRKSRVLFRAASPSPAPQPGVGSGARACSTCNGKPARRCTLCGQTHRCDDCGDQKESA